MWRKCSSDSSERSDPQGVITDGRQLEDDCLEDRPTQKQSNSAVRSSKDIIYGTAGNTTPQVSDPTTRNFSKMSLANLKQSLRSKWRHSSAVIKASLRRISWMQKFELQPPRDYSMWLSVCRTVWWLKLPFPYQTNMNLFCCSETEPHLNHLTLF